MIACANDDGVVACWGSDLNDELDDDLFVTRNTTPVSIVVEGVVDRVGTCAHVRRVRRQRGVLGANESGGLGDGTTITSDGSRKPVMLGAGGGLLDNVIALSAGESFTCALSGSAGGATAYCWGANAVGQLGSDGPGAIVAEPVVGSTQYTSIASGTSTTCAIDTDKNVWCWGANQFGQAGQAPGFDDLLAPVAVPTMTSVSDAIAIAVGDNHACAMHENGEIVCWGGNGYGQLGDGMTNHHNSACAVDCSWDPVTVMTP